MYLLSLSGRDRNVRERRTGRWILDNLFRTVLVGAIGKLGVRRVHRTAFPSPKIGLAFCIGNARPAPPREAEVSTAIAIVPVYVTVSNRWLSIANLAYLGRLERILAYIAIAEP
jgi:hypothetical protein